MLAKSFSKTVMRDEVFKSSKQQELSLLLLPSYCLILLTAFLQPAERKFPVVSSDPTYLPQSGMSVTGHTSTSLTSVYSSVTNVVNHSLQWQDSNKLRKTQDKVSGAALLLCGVKDQFLTVCFMAPVVVVDVTWPSISSQKWSNREGHIESILPLLVHRLRGRLEPHTELQNILSRQNLRTSVPSAFLFRTTWAREAMCLNHSHKTAWQLNSTGPHGSVLLPLLA